MAEGLTQNLIEVANLIKGGVRFESCLDYRKLSTVGYMGIMIGKYNKYQNGFVKDTSSP